MPSGPCKSMAHVSNLCCSESSPLIDKAWIRRARWGFEGLVSKHRERLDQGQEPAASSHEPRCGSVLRSARTMSSRFGIRSGGIGRNRPFRILGRAHRGVAPGWKQPSTRRLSRIAQLDQRTALRTNVCTRRKRTCGSQGGSPGLDPKADQRQNGCDVAS